MSNEKYLKKHDDFFDFGVEKGVITMVSKIGKERYFFSKER
jgi:hypothetical protein